MSRCLQCRFVSASDQASRVDDQLALGSQELQRWMPKLPIGSSFAGNLGLGFPKDHLPKPSPAMH